MLASRAPLAFAFALLVTAGCTPKAQGGAPAPGAAAPERPAGRLLHLDPTGFQRLAAEKKGLLLDVRTPGEVARGVMAGATVLDFNDARFAQRVALLQRDRPVFVYCASGGRSSSAAEAMVRMGFSEVYNLEGGLRAWAGAGLPVEAPTEAPPASPKAELTPAAFDALVAAEPRALVEFRTEWCVPCRKMAPVIDALEQAHLGKLKVIRVDVDASEALAAREKVEGLPLLVLYDGGKARWRKSGELTREALEAALAAP